MLGIAEHDSDRSVNFRLRGTHGNRDRGGPPQGRRLGRYSAEAQALGVSMGAYLRRRLEEQDRIAASLDELHEAVERAALVAPPAAALPARLEGAIAELLLLLRSIASPQKTAMVQAEVARRGLETWK